MTKENPTELKDEIYRGHRLKVWHMSAFIMIALFIGFIANIPLETIAVKIIEKQLSLLPCSIQHSNIEFQFILPKLNIYSVTIPGRCLNSDATGELNIPKITTAFNGISFSPFGLIVETKIPLGSNRLTLKNIISFSKVITRIDHAQIDLDFLFKELRLPYQLRGLLSVTAVIEMTSNALTQAHISIGAQNFQIPKQQLMNFDIPYLTINALEFKGIIDSHYNLRIEKLLMGRTNSPIITSLNGLIKLAAPISNSELDLQGELKFSQQFVDSFAIISIMFSSIPLKNGFYHIKIQGTLGQPKALPL